MDVNSSDQNGKPSINVSAEDPKESKEKSELPVNLRPKFSQHRLKKRHRRQKQKSSASKETVSRDISRDDDVTHEKLEIENKPTEDREEEKQPSRETPEADDRNVGEKDTREREPREKEPREKEIEEPECRESEIRIIPIEVQTSDTDVRKITTPIVIQDDKSGEKKPKGKKEKLDSLDEGEKKRSKEGGASRRRKRADRRKKNSGRAKLQGSERKRRRNRVSREKMNPSPRASLKINNSAENIGIVRKSKVANKTADGEPKKGQPKKKFTFLKSIIDKTKLWMRKSDDVAQPTKEVLYHMFVSPEYSTNNHADFAPDPKSQFTAAEWAARLKNSRCEPDAVFINNRPFWIFRTSEDVIPKVKLLAFHALVAQHGRDGCFHLKEIPKRTFYDPRTVSFEKLMRIDRAIGVDPMDPTKEKELLRVTSNTYCGTLYMQAYRTSQEGKRKMEDFEAKYAKETAAIPVTPEDNKKSAYSAPKVTFDLSFALPSTVTQPAKDPFAEKSQLAGPQYAVYNRKERPPFGSIRVFAARELVLEVTRKQSRMQVSVSADPQIVKNKN